MADFERPRVGVASFVINENGKILMGKRKNDYGHGTWSLPGGKLELFEDPEHCAAREAFEETGLMINVESEFGFSSQWDQGQHWVTLFYIATKVKPEQEPKVTEPDKCYRWEWMDWII